MNEADYQSRIVELESALAQSQYDLDQISQVVHQQNRQMENLETRLKRLEEQRTVGEDDLPDPLDEKPPHY